MNALEHLRHEEHFTETERQIARFILAQPETVTRMSSRELARETFTSPTSVLRFCKRLGFENYNDFKVNIVSALKSIDLANTIVMTADLDSPLAKACSFAPEASMRAGDTAHVSQ